MNKEKLLMMFKKNIDKIVIIFIVFLSFLVLGFWGYRSFHLPNKKEVIGVKVNNFQYKAKNIPEFARQDFLLFVQQLDADEEIVFGEKKVDRQNIERNIKILKDQGIWDGLCVEPGKITKCPNYIQDLYISIQDSQKAFQLQVDELLKKTEEEKDLESFRKELKKLREKHQKDIDVFVEFTQRIQKEAKEPIPFFATWIGMGISVVICLIVTFILAMSKYREVSKAITNFKNYSSADDIAKKDSLIEKTLLDSIRKEVLEYLALLMYCFFIVYLPLHFLIFPFINCFLSLKMSSFRETYKHYLYNKFKFCSLFMVPVIWLSMIMVAIFLYNSKYDCYKNNENKGKDGKEKPELEYPLGDGMETN